MSLAVRGHPRRMPCWAARRLLDEVADVLGPGSTVLTSEYEAERRALCQQGALVACLIAIALLSAFVIVDRVAFPDRAGLLLAVRIICVASLVPCLALLRSRFASNHALGASLTLSLLLASMVDVIIMLTGGVTSQYYAGLSLILMGMTVLLPWPPLWSLLNSALIVLGYAALVSAQGLTDPVALVTALAFLTSMATIAGISSTISERLRWREYMHRTHLAQAVRHKREFLASVSHDLRTPLNVILGYTQLIAEQTLGPVTTEQDDALGRILRATNSQLALVNDLLDLARIEQGKLVCTLRTTPVGDLVPTLRETMDALLLERPVRFEVDIPPDAMVTTDPERLRQVLVNLLTNAVKFTQRGCIRLEATREGDVVRLSVRDTGVGMDAALRSRIFEPFVSGNGQDAGWGLGLTIVARLVELLKGTVAVESTPGAGTTVHVRLPGSMGMPAAVTHH